MEYKIFKGKTMENMFLMIFLLIWYIFIIKESNKNYDKFSDKLVQNYKNFNYIIHLIGVFILPSPYLKRPFRIIWRLFQGGALVYLFNLCFILITDKKTLFILLNYFDPNLPDQSPEKTYAEDCRIYTPENPNSNFNNLYQSFDIFIFAHFTGWIVRTFVFRSAPLLWFLSLGFEFCELTFRYWLNNFYECWWDSLLWDLFGMNLLGILIGFYVIKKFNMKKYYWFIKPLEQDSSKNINIFKRFKNFWLSGHLYKDNQNWHMLSNLSNYLKIIYLIIFNFLFDLNLFFMKFILKIPPNHFVIIFRMSIVGFFSVLFMSDYYVYIKKNKEDRKITINMYIGNSIIVLETLFIFIFSDFKNDYKKIIPNFFKISWLIVLLIIVLGGILSYRNSLKKIKNK